MTEPTDFRTRYREPGARLDADSARSKADIELASRWTRLFAYIIDSIIVFVPMIFIGLSLPGANEVVTPQETLLYLVVPVQRFYDFINILIGFFLYGLFNGYYLVTYGQTIGKRLLNIKIVDKDTNEIVSFTRVFLIRYCLVSAFGMIPFVGFIFPFIDAVFIFGAPRRCVHDYIAGTIVIKT